MASMSLLKYHIDTTVSNFINLSMKLCSFLCSLDKMGAIRRTFLAEHQIWRLFSCPWMHAGAFHFTVNLVGIITIGIYLEKEFGPGNHLIVLFSLGKSMPLDIKLTQNDGDSYYCSLFLLCSKDWDNLHNVCISRYLGNCTFC